MSMKMKWDISHDAVSPRISTSLSLVNKVHARTPLPRTLPELEIALHEEWGQIPLILVPDLYLSTPRQMLAVILENAMI